jgi:pimeloyl-ACP methyl ester carboxylesterase
MLDPLPQSWFALANDVPWARVTFDGRPIPYRLLQQNPSLERPIAVCLHGMGVTVASFWPLSPWLFQTHDLLLVDYNGFSTPGSWPRGGVTFPVMAAGIERVLRAVGARQFDLLGNSLGGGLALLVAALAPALVRRVVLFNPAVYPQDLPAHYRLVRIPLLGELLMRLIPPNAFADGVANVAYRDPKQMDPFVRAEYNRCMRGENRFRLMDDIRNLPASARERHALAERVHLVHQPVLLVWGELEHLLTPSSGVRLARALPNVTVAPFAELAHGPHEEGAAVVGPIVAKFLNSTESDDK